MSRRRHSVDPLDILELGRLLGQRRAFAAIGGRCSAAHAQLLRRIRDEKLYLRIAPSWRAFCSMHLAITRRHADRLIAMLNRFGPVYFEVSQLIGISPRQYLSIEPAIREHKLLVDGEAISLIPENAPKVIEALGQLLLESRRIKRPAAPPESLRTGSPISPAADTPSPPNYWPSTTPPALPATANSSKSPLPKSAWP